MRITVFSNLFPPVWVGGYEIGAARVARELRRRGHEVLILTARQALIWRDGRFVCQNQPGGNGTAMVDVGPCVMGSLGALARRAPWRLPLLLPAVLRARACYGAALDAFGPELLLLFNPLGVLAPVVADCLAWGRKRHIPVHAYVSDPWPAEWPRAHPLWRSLPFLAGPAPRSKLDLYCSRYLRDQVGRPHDRVVPWGVPDMKQRGPLPVRDFQAREPLTLLFAGQLEPHKGLTLLLCALAECRRPHRLVVLGDDRTAHGRACRQLAVDLGLSQRVEFVGKQPPEAVPGLLPLLGQVLVVPSLWQEPLSLTLLEGMAAGLAVVASRTGGSPEAITPGQTGFLFDPQHPVELTEILDHLEEDRSLCQRVGTAAQQEVRQHFTLEGMVDRLLSLEELPGEDGPERKDVALASGLQSPVGRR